MISLTKPSEKKYWKHSTQKPFELLERIILASSNEWDLILDPFSWSWTTWIAALKHKRKYIWIEKEKDFVELSIRRFRSLNH